MRNYYKIFGEWVRLKNSRGAAWDMDLVWFGATKEELTGRVAGSIVEAQQTIIDSGFTSTLERHPVVIYFELNKENFVTLLNGWDQPGGKNAIWVWNATALPKFANFSDAYEDMTVFESPRKTWSHGD